MLPVSVSCPREFLKKLSRVGLLALRVSRETDRRADSVTGVLTRIRPRLGSLTRESRSPIEATPTVTVVCLLGVLSSIKHAREILATGFLTEVQRLPFQKPHDSPPATPLPNQMLAARLAARPNQMSSAGGAEIRVLM